MAQAVEMAQAIDSTRLKRNLPQPEMKTQVISSGGYSLKQRQIVASPVFTTGPNSWARAYKIDHRPNDVDPIS